MPRVQEKKPSTPPVKKRARPGTPAEETLAPAGAAVNAFELDGGPPDLFACDPRVLLMKWETLPPALQACFDPATGEPARHVRPYLWRAGMRSLSGAGGFYEATCRAMVWAGLRWLDEHPGAGPVFRGTQATGGVVHPVNEDADALKSAIVKILVEAPPNLVREALEACLFVRKHGWEMFVKVMS